MNYHVNRDGQNLGSFPLEELRRRRTAGQLTGKELIWTEGMAAWLPLDSILPPVPPGHASPPVEKPKSDWTLVWVLTAMALLLGGSITVGLIVVRPALNEFLAKISAIPRELAAGSSAMDAATKPVPINPHTLTAADVLKSQREFRVRQYLEGYELRGERDPECDALAEGMISNWIACNYGGVVNSNLPSLAVMCDRLARDPDCTDPLVLTVAGVNAVELREAIRRLQRAVKGFQNSDHLAYPKLYATVSLEDRLIENGTNSGMLDAQALQYLQAAFTDGSLRPEDQAEIADILLNGWGRSFFGRNAIQIYTIIQGQGKQFQWLALVLEGQTEINAAWAARGGGYENTVSAAGWQGFAQHLASARRYLTEAWKLRPNLPLAPDRMIYVSLGDSDINEMRVWFDRTVTAQIDYPDAWSQTRWGLRPRWYGDTDSMLAFGVTALNTHRFDTDVPHVYFDSLSDVESEMQLPSGEHIYGRDDIWTNLEE